MIEIGLNGLGRIGKSLLVQCLKEKNIKINAINVPNYNINTLASYLSHDTIHKEIIDKDSINILDNETISINNNVIKLLDNRTPVLDMWKKNNVKYLFDTTGVFLTEEKAQHHNVDYFIMCAPSKDKTPQYLFNGNHEKYSGEKIISNSSCTTNSIVPLLKILDDKYGIETANFLTVHAATASQHVIDGVHLKSRIHRSIINNIIPHSTGASKSAIKILPNLEGKIYGTSVRIPTNNVSMVDLNVKLNTTQSINNIFNFLRNKSEIIVNDDKHLVSTDFMTTTNPTIVDSNASMEMSKGEYKFTIWYDNEWSYSSQGINMLKYMFYNKI
tara:strand:+ start:570 stop:1556 length:987 start_codon:yes stop_codon:yes gene_type:complete